jgi:hypothetical protein
MAGIGDGMKAYPSWIVAVYLSIRTVEGRRPPPMDGGGVRSPQPSSHFTCSGVSLMSKALRLSSSSCSVRGPIRGMDGKGWAST